MPVNVYVCVCWAYVCASNLLAYMQTICRVLKYTLPVSSDVRHRFIADSGCTLVTYMANSAPKNK